MADLTAVPDWVAVWTASPQPAAVADLPPEPFLQNGLVLADATLRQTIRLSADVTQLRLRVSNAFGSADLRVGRMSVALPEGGQAGLGALAPGTAQKVTFIGRPDVTVSPGADAVSDPLDFPVTAGTNVTVTLWLPDGVHAVDGVTTHPGSRTTSWLVEGDAVMDEALDGIATAVDHWYFLSGADGQSSLSPDPSGGVVVCLGDSLTDGRGSTTNGNDRWPDQFLDRLPPEHHLAVVNQGIGGNRVLNDGLGPAIVARLDRDVLAVPGVRWLILFAGVNDIGTAAATADAQRQVAHDLCEAYDNIARKAHAVGIAVYGATLTPLAGNDPYDDATGHREAARQAVNAWIRSGGAFDAVLDFDAAVRSPKDRRRLRPEYDTGDGLHLTPKGYQALANAVPVSLFGATAG